MQEKRQLGRWGVDRTSQRQHEDGRHDCSPEVKPNYRLNCHLVAGRSTVHKPSLLHVGEWDVHQTKKVKVHIRYKCLRLFVSFWVGLIALMCVKWRMFPLSFVLLIIVIWCSTQHGEMSWLTAETYSWLFKPVNRRNLDTMAPPPYRRLSKWKDGGVRIRDILALFLKLRLVVHLYS